MPLMALLKDCKLFQTACLYVNQGCRISVNRLSMLCFSFRLSDQATFSYNLYSYQRRKTHMIGKTGRFLSVGLSAELSWSQQHRLTLFKRDDPTRTVLSSLNGCWPAGPVGNRTRTTRSPFI